jgi:methyl-accepting chemotaxis protein
MATETKKRLSISFKIFLVSLCFSLPLVVLAYFVIDNIDQNSRIARLEMAGDAYQTPLEALLRDTMEHQRLAHHCPENADCKSQRAALEGSIKNSFADLHAADLKYGQQLEFTLEGLAKRKRESATRENLEKSWLQVTGALKNSNDQVSDEIDAKYDAVNTIINTMITHLGDTSTLILDPELDTYYTMDITLLALPQNQNRIERMIADARKAFSHSPFTVEDRMTFAANAALLQAADIDRVSADVQTALNENKNDFHDAVDSFQKNMPVAFKEWADVNGKLVALTRELSTAEQPAVTLDQYIDAAIKARESAFRFWTVAAPENDNLF